MDKENNRCAAGLRRSAVVERIRLREEWSALKGIPEANASNREPTRIVGKKAQHNANVTKKIKPLANHNKARTSDVLRGVVALVEVGPETRALPLRAALGALGATVVPTWNPLVTHLIWAQGGCRGTRAKARALASRLVSPLWVEACAASNRRLPEQTFPAAARASDLPSPRTLRRLLKQAEMQNIPLVDLLSDSKEEDGPKPNRLRISSDSEHNTTDATVDTSHDTTRDTTHDTTDIPRMGRLRQLSLSTINEETTLESTQSDKIYATPENNVTDVEARVNTAPRRALPTSVTPLPPKRSRRKLFTQKEAEANSDDDEDGEEPVARRVDPRLRQRARRELARAERLARRMVAACTPACTPAPTPGPINTRPRVALTGMSRSERQAVCEAIRSLNGRLQGRVTHKTTHVLLGSCREDPDTTCPNFSGITSITCQTNADLIIPRCDIQKARTLNALAGAARGCRVLYGQWALDSLKANRWLHHHGYEVPHLKKISQKARVERKALGRMRSDYAYDVFSGMKVRLSSSVEQKDAATQLLALCGAVVIDSNGHLPQINGLTQNGGRLRDGEQLQDGGFDLTLGTGNGEVSSKWVFDSVAAARMRTTRRYVNSAVRTSFESQQTDR